MTSPDLDVAKDTRTVISDRVRILHTHEAKCASLESKCEKATEAIGKHKTAKEDAKKWKRRDIEKGCRPSKRISLA